MAVADDTDTGNVEGGDEVFLMRNSKDSRGQILRFTSEEWEKFITHIKEGAGL